MTEQCSGPVQPQSPILFQLPRNVLKFIVTRNPFYLISMCFVLHGTAQLMPRFSDPYNPWPLMGMVCGYIFMIALTGFAVARFGKVWDDARSIFLILLGLFVVLSLTFDDPLLKDHGTGRTLILLGFGFCILVCEGLLVGLRIRLPPLFRLPTYSMLALVFLYPLFVIHPDPMVIRWRIFLFSPLTAAVFLTLLPAIKEGAAYVKNNGTPWRWPYYPWIPVCALGMGVCLRGYVLSLSFDPVLSIGYSSAMELPTVYGTYFLSPIILALAVLLLNAGLIAKRSIVQCGAMLFPIAAIWLSLPPTSYNTLYGEFLYVFEDMFGSPTYICIVLSGAIYAWAWTHGIKFAETAFFAVVLFGALLDPFHAGWNGWITPKPEPLFCLAMLQLVRCIQVRSSHRAVLTVMFASSGFLSSGYVPGSQFEILFVTANLVLVSLLLIGIVFRDDLARFLRNGAGFLMLVAIVATLWLPMEFPAPLTPPFRDIYGTTLILTILFLALVNHGRFLLICAGMSVAAQWLTVSWKVLQYLERLPEGRGIRSFLVGFVVLAIAAIVSATKARLIASLRLKQQR